MTDAPYWSVLRNAIRGDDNEQRLIAKYGEAAMRSPFHGQNVPVGQLAHNSRMVAVECFSVLGKSGLVDC